MSHRGYLIRRSSRIVALLLVLSLSVGVLGVTANAQEDGERLKIGLVMKSLANEFFQQMQAGAEEYAEEHADEFEFEAVGMQDERDFAAQVDAVENFITQQFDIIVIAPADSRAMVGPISRAIDAGIVVINIDVALDEEAKEEAGVELAFFGPDNREGARLAGAALGEALGQGGRVVILEGNPEADNAVQRKLGFEDAIEEYELELLDSRTAHWETEEANEIMTNFLTQYPDVQGVMAANDSMALGVVSALAAAGRDDVLVVGFDNIPAVQPLILEGSMLATVEQFGAQMAVMGIEFGMRTLEGEEFEGWVKTPIELITAEVLEEMMAEEAEATEEPEMEPTEEADE